MDNKNLTVPYIAYESMLVKEDRQHKRMIIVIIMLTILLVVTNAIWIYEWEYSEKGHEPTMAYEADNEVEQDG